MTTISCPVVRIANVQRHPNADKLSLMEVEGCPVLFNHEQTHEGDLVAYIPIDSVVPTTVPEFSFLTRPGRDVERVQAKRLRGIFSMGFVVPARPHWQEGQDVAAELGVIKYEEPLPAPRVGKGGAIIQTDQSPPPRCNPPVYDVESYRKYSRKLNPGEMVVVTEKIHGCNFRAVYDDGQLYVGTHRTWRKFDERNTWWAAAVKYRLPEILSQYPGCVFYGEVYGDIQDLTYGCAKGEHRLAIFDIYDSGGELVRDGLGGMAIIENLNTASKWLPWPEVDTICEIHSLPTVPVLYEGPYDEQMCRNLAEQPNSTVAPEQIMEGIVVKPLSERFDPHIGRLILKLLSSAYMLRKNGTEYH